MQNIKNPRLGEKIVNLKMACVDKSVEAKTIAYIKEANHVDETRSVKRMWSPPPPRLDENIVITVNFDK